VKSGTSFPVMVVVVTLATISILGMGIMGYLAMTQTPIPDQIDRLTFGALTALGALLATTRGNDQSTPVTVVNNSDQAVPVETQT
jgi:TRAP-type C4-dicarboxylate transport system permease small subunit